ncbi:MAG: peptidase [Kiloniellaceae bacterium]
MTYCLGIKVRDGLVCLADGRITSGNQVTNAQKLSMHGAGEGQFAVMTSGLRSLRDKTLSYLDRDIRDNHPTGFATLLDAVTAYCRCLRKVAKEDREQIEGSDLSFNLHTLIAGALPEDGEASIFLVYPEANWIEVDHRTPYLSIGATAYGKPILDRALTYDTAMTTALKLAYLSFDSSRFSSADVGFPIDLATYSRAEERWRKAHYDYDDLRDQRIWWNEHIKKLAIEMPDGPWASELRPGTNSARLTIVSEDKG